ncbi:hypothetical protein C8J57DRAFT_1505169 [Mycena rebaudengoi]|nr:hypothetical protein C8J57DRAFT_1505169 [Mycena rebaudengoi]
MATVRDRAVHTTFKALEAAYDWTNWDFGQFSSRPPFPVQHCSSFVFSNPPSIYHMAATSLTTEAMNLRSPLLYDGSQFSISTPHLTRSSAATMQSHEEFGPMGNATVPFIYDQPTISTSFPVQVSWSDFVQEQSTHSTDSTPDTPTTADAEASYPIAHPDATTTEARRRTWPSMVKLRRRVSGIFNRKSVSSLPANPPPSPVKPELGGDMAPPAPPRRTFSFSLRSRTSSIGRRNIPAQHVEPVSNIATRRQQVRRSRSFSGFTTMAHHVLYSIPELNDADEIGVEAYNTLRGIEPFWAYEDTELGAAAALLERGVERR